MSFPRPLPHVSGILVFSLSLGVLFFASMVVNYSPLVGFLDAVAGVLPSPLTGSTVAAVVFLALVIVVTVKVFDAPAALGSGVRFRRLERKLAHRPGVYSPGGLAAYIGRRKYGAGKFQRLGVRGRSRRA